MINYVKNKVEIVCDNCDTESFEADTLEEAIERMEVDGWDSYYDGDDWIHICSVCRGREDDDFDTSSW